MNGRCLSLSLLSINGTLMACATRIGSGETNDVTFLFGAALLSAICAGLLYEKDRQIDFSTEPQEEKL